MVPSTCSSECHRAEATVRRGSAIRSSRDRAAGIERLGLRFWMCASIVSVLATIEVVLNDKSIRSLFRQTSIPGICCPGLMSSCILVSVRKLIYLHGRRQQRPGWLVPLSRLCESLCTRHKSTAAPHRCSLISLAQTPQRVPLKSPPLSPTRDITFAQLLLLHPANTHYAL